MKMKFIWPLVISLACLLTASHATAKSGLADNKHYTSKDKEFYLTPEQQYFIRPGLELDILEVLIPTDRQTEVTFRLTDPGNQPLDRLGINTPGPISTSFVLAFIPRDEESYVAYTTSIQTSPITGDSAEQGSTDSGGSYTDLGDGSYRYKFGTVLPDDYDKDVTHSLGIYARRDLLEYDLDRYVANELEHFVPSGSAEPTPRDIVTTETCNGRCHDPLALHGGSRQKVELCVLCHNPSQGVDPDTGNSVDMPLMIHKIHMGANLAEGYTIIGYRQSVHDYSEVIYPAPMNECEACHTGGIPTENFPMVATPSAALVCDSSAYGETTLSWQHSGNVEIMVRTATDPVGKLFTKGEASGSMATGKWVTDGTIFDIYDADSMALLQSVPVNATVLGCVADAPGTARGRAGAQHTKWLEPLNRVSCVSCHDYIDWETGAGHSDYDLVMADDNTCDHCHTDYTGINPELSIRGSHMELYKSARLPGVVINLIEVTNTNPGDYPTVRFTVGSKNAWLDPAKMNRLRFTLSGPNEDFSFRAQETVGDSAVWAGDNWWTYLYTFSTPLPEDAEGSWTISAEGRTLVEVDVGYEASEERDNAENPMLAFAVTDSVATPRRTIVGDYNCESCHSNLSFHGGSRHDPLYCGTCHMPESVDRRGEQTIHLKYMIHSIHRGQDLENGFSIGNHDYSEVVYPGDLRNCDTCHVNNSQQVPVPDDLLSTLTLQAWWSPMMPNAAACLSCHDGDDTALHAITNTAPFGEACGVCHGEGRHASVDKVHAQ